MKIRTQFILSTVILGSILLLVAAAAIITDRLVQKAHRQETLATQIEREAYELGYLTDDYLLYRESQLANRWDSKFASFSNDLAAIMVNTAEQQVLLDDMKTDQQQLKGVFTEIRASNEASPQAQEAAFGTKFIQVSWSRLEVQNQAMIFNASRMVQFLRAQEDGLERATSLISFITIAVLALYLFGNYGLAFRRILKAIAELQAGAKIIGGGDLDYAITVKNSGEIGELSQAFNQMTADLKQVTASKADLEKEIRVREEAEAALRQNEKRLEALYLSMTEGIASHEILYENNQAVDYVITGVNPAYERITGLVISAAIGRKATDLYGTESAPYLELYARVAAGGKPESFETYFAPMDKHFSISVFSPEKGEFATVFTDVSERKKAEEVLKAANEELTQFNRAMVGRELRMIELKKEVDELCKQGGQPLRYYPVAEAEV